MTRGRLEKLKKESSFMPKNHKQWFVYYLFEDEEFKREKEVIIANLKTFMNVQEYGLVFLLSRKIGLIKQLEERHESKRSKIQKLFNLNELQAVGEDSDEGKIINAIKKLAKQFDVSEKVVEQGLVYTKHRTSVGSIPAVYVDGDEVVIRLDATMRFEDLRSSYPYIQQLQSKLPGYKSRNRPQVHPELIFAIYKQRLARRTFKEIYTLYEQNELPGYDGDNRIIGEEALARMYRKYKPAI